MPSISIASSLAMASDARASGDRKPRGRHVPRRRAEHDRRSAGAQLSRERCRDGAVGDGPVRHVAQLGDEPAAVCAVQLDHGLSLHSWNKLTGFTIICQVCAVVAHAVHDRLLMKGPTQGVAVDVSLVIRRRLEELGLEQKDLARAARVTESYVSQLLKRRRAPPAPNRTDIYDRMGKLLRLPTGELARLAEVQRKEALKQELGETEPLYREVRQLVLR